MSWADFAAQSPVVAWVLAFSTVGIFWYAVATIRGSILARYNLQMAAQRTTQEGYLVDLLKPVLAENATLVLNDPVHRHALAKVLAERIVVGGDQAE
jgi:hypothetical protein